MENLNKYNLIEPLLKNIEKGKPLLGICLGMQLFAELGEEFGPNPGLNLIPGVISKIKNNGLRLPHIGWNKVLKPNEGNSILFSGIPDKTCFYFIHSFSYTNISEKYIIGKTNYGIDLVAAVQSQNVFGVQFHPEKSQSYAFIYSKIS